MTLEFDVDIGYITDDGSKDMPQWVKLNDEDGQHPSTVYVNNDSYQRSISENAKLREQIDAAHMSRLLTENENELLRELLIDVSEEVPWSFMDTTKYCMPLRADKLRKLLCRMRELGVEVDG
jgi:hypothetical protein